MSLGIPQKSLKVGAAHCFWNSYSILSRIALCLKRMAERTAKQLSEVLLLGTSRAALHCMMFAGDVSCSLLSVYLKGHTETHVRRAMHLTPDSRWTYCGVLYKRRYMNSFSFIEIQLTMGCTLRMKTHCFSSQVVLIY